MVELDLETRLLDLRRPVVTVHCSEILALLRENPVAVQIAVEAKITEDVEGVIDVFKRPAWFVAAVAAFA